MGELRRFYRKFYIPQNCVVSVVSPQSFEETLELAKNILGAGGKVRDILKDLV